MKIFAVTLLGAFAISNFACTADSSSSDGVSKHDALSSDATPDVPSGSTPYFFSHSVAFVSNSTYQAIQTSSWLENAFSTITVDTKTTPEQPKVTQHFAHTRLVFFADGMFGFPPGMTGFGFSSETPGGLERATRAFEDAFGKDGVSTFADPLRIGGQAATTHGSEVLFSGPFFSWVNETTLDSAPRAPLPRAELEKSEYAPAKLANDVVAVRIALGPEDGARFERTLQLVGWSVEKHDAYFVGRSPSDAGIQRTVVVEPSEGERRGLSEAVISLNRYESHEEQLGDARLTVGVRGKKVAVLQIHPPRERAAVDAL